MYHHLHVHTLPYPPLPIPLPFSVLIYLPCKISTLYSVSPSPGSDISMQTQLVSICTHSLFVCVCELVCTISLDARDLELRFANKRATSLPGDGETKYTFFWLRTKNNIHRQGPFTQLHILLFFIDSFIITATQGANSFQINLRFSLTVHIVSQFHG